MAVFNNILAGASGQTTGAAGYQIERSLRFNSSDSAYLSRTPASAGNRRTWTWSGWVKRCNETATRILSTFTIPWTDVAINGSNQIQIVSNAGSGGEGFRTDAVLRDFSAWYHIVIAVDTTQATATDRVKFYINGTQAQTITLAGGATPQNYETSIDATNEHHIGRSGRTGYGGVQYTDDYFAEIHFIDGQALDPTSFTETDATTGQLVPIEYTGTYGTNGFHLPFSDNSTAAALGTDTSGAGNDWTPNNLAVTGSSTSTTGNISLGSTPRNFYFKGLVGHQLSCALGNHVWDSSNGSSWTYRGVSSSTVTLTSTYLLLTGNTNISFTNTNSDLVTYWDLSLGEGVPSGTGSTYTWNVNAYGAQNIDSLVDTPTNYGTDTGAGGEVRGNYCTWNPLNKGSSITTSDGNLKAQLGSNGHVMITGTMGMTSDKYYWEIVTDGWITSNQGPMVGVVGDTHDISTQAGGSPSILYRAEGAIYVNGSSVVTGQTTFTTGDVIGVALDLADNHITWYKNGSQMYEYTTVDASVKAWIPAWKDSDSGGNAVGNWGQRPFAYTAPSGYKALCTANLDDPLVAQPSTVMDVVTYTGNGSTQTISGLEFSPDLVWLKSRSGAFNHRLIDQVQGNTSTLASNLTTAAVDCSSDFTGFTSDGFSVSQTASFELNNSSHTYVAWTWDAGSSTVTNTDGSITSSVRANASAGFSIVTYTSGSAPTVGHGLGVAPSLIIAKSRTVALNWTVYHRSLGKDYVLELSSTNSAANITNYWGTSEPNSTIFGTYGTGSNGNNAGNMVAYCFAPVDGYSSFGSYTGNGSTDGPFVYTGHKVKWLMVKRTDSAEPWWMWDVPRSTAAPGNPMNALLRANGSDQEYAPDTAVDSLSNGFKPRSSSANVNASGGTYVYMSFAESPFKTARAR